MFRKVRVTQLLWMPRLGLQMTSSFARMLTQPTCTRLTYIDAGEFHVRFYAEVLIEDLPFQKALILDLNHLVTSLIDLRI
jgi:hypothetical protein